MYRADKDKEMTIHGLITRITAVARRRTIQKGYKDKEDKGDDDVTNDTK